MGLRKLRSVSLPITLTAVAVSLSIAMLVGWTLIIVRVFLGRPDVSGGVWLLVLGTISFLVVMTVLVLFGISLVRQILEARRQVSFIDSVTHELKSPLASLKLCLQTMGRADLEEEQRARLRAMMEADVSRLSSFIDDVLHASRAISGELPVTVWEVDLDLVLRETVDELRRRHELPGDAIRIQETGIELMTDGAALRVVITNLVDNAVKYSDRPPSVTVNSRRLDGGGLLIEVTDAGIGISPKDLSRVFQRFYRAPESAVKARRGTGLGLFVASAMARNLGGRIEARSPGLGRGTTMSVLLPAAAVLEGQGEARAGVAEGASA